MLSFEGKSQLWKHWTNCTAVVDPGFPSRTEWYWATRSRTSLVPLGSANAKSKKKCSRKKPRILPIGFRSKKWRMTTNATKRCPASQGVSQNIRILSVTEYKFEKSNYCVQPLSIRLKFLNKTKVVSNSLVGNISRLVTTKHLYDSMVAWNVFLQEKLFKCPVSLLWRKLTHSQLWKADTSLRLKEEWSETSQFTNVSANKLSGFFFRHYIDQSSFRTYCSFFRFLNSTIWPSTDFPLLSNLMLRYLSKNSAVFVSLPGVSILCVNTFQSIQFLEFYKWVVCKGSACNLTAQI